MALHAARQADIAALQDPLVAKTTRWFCEVKLKALKGLLANHFKLDSWFFPVDFRIRKTGYGPTPVLRRRLGEQGEVPDWEGLNRMFSDRYPIATEITKIISQ